MGLFTRSKETAPCQVTISHRFEELSAHVKFNKVHGEEIMAPYGEVVVEDRLATITRASKIEQLWTRATGDFEFMELCEFSFSEEVLS